MSDSNKIDTRYNYTWIHNVFGHFIKDTMDYFTDYLYPRFSDWKIIGSYDKAVEYINKQMQHAREMDQPLRPALILDPSGDFNFDETYGKQPWRYPNLAPGLVKYIFDPIYQDQNIIITVGFSRIVGELNFTGLMSSFYEYTDMRVYLNLIFGGTDRIIYPRWFNSFIILPQEISTYRYKNDVTGESYQLNIENAYNQLVKTTNTNELVFPCTIKPLYKLSGITDSSARLGGVDGLPDWKLGFTVNYEVEIPTFIVLETNYLAEKLNVNIGYESCYSANKSYLNNEIQPENIDSFSSVVLHGLDSTSCSTVSFPTESEIINKKTKIVRTRYYHIISQLEVDSTSVVVITIPEVINDKDLISISGKYGDLLYGDHYKILEDNVTLEIDKNNVSFELNEILEIYMYMYT